MFTTLQIVTLMLAALAMVPALAHALEFPGKKRLAKDAYLTVQRIYYPGFTIVGIAEVLGIVAALALVIFTPRDGAAFTLSLAALVLLLAMHGGGLLLVGLPRGLRVSLRLRLRLQHGRYRGEQRSERKCGEKVSLAHCDFPFQAGKRNR